LQKKKKWLLLRAVRVLLLALLRRRLKLVSRARVVVLFFAPPPPTRPQEANPTDYVKAYRDVIGTREWELTHNHLLFTFRLYYRGDQLDPHFPPPNDLVPLSAEIVQSHRNRGTGNATSSRGRKRSRHRGDAGGRDRHGTINIDEDDEDDGDEEEEEAGTAAANAVAHAINGATSSLPAFGTDAAAASAATRHETATMGSADVPAADSATAADPEADERRRLLREVKEHLEILKEFEGVVPADELAQRKRALFLALPPAPPPLPPLPIQHQHQQQQQHSDSPRPSSSGQRREQPSIDLNGAKRSRT
jgi:hypothetical protein